MESGRWNEEGLLLGHDCSNCLVHRSVFKMLLYLPSLPSKPLNNKQRLFRIYTSRKYRYPVSAHMVFGNATNSSCMLIHPLLTSWRGFKYNYLSSNCLLCLPSFSFLPSAFHSPTLLPLSLLPIPSFPTSSFPPLLLAACRSWIAGMDFGHCLFSAWSSVLEISPMQTWGERLFQLCEQCSVGFLQWL